MNFTDFGVQRLLRGLRTGDQKVIALGLGALALALLRRPKKRDLVVESANGARRRIRCQAQQSDLIDFDNRPAATPRRRPSKKTTSKSSTNPPRAIVAPSFAVLRVASAAPLELLTFGTNIADVDLGVSDMTLHPPCEHADHGQ